MSRYPIAKDFKKIDRPMPYHKLLFPLARPVQKLMLRCVPLLEGLTVSKESIPGFQGKPVPVELYRPAGKSGKLPCVLLFHGGGFGYRAAPTTSGWPWNTPGAWAVWWRSRTITCCPAIPILRQGKTLWLRTGGCTAKGKRCK